MSDRRRDIHMRMGRSTLGATRVLGVCAAGVLLLSACTGGDQEDDGKELAQDGLAGESPESLADFCESSPEVTEEDREGVLEVGTVPEGNAEEVPMPYVDQLAEDTNYQPPSENGPAENVPRPELSALLCHEDAGREGASAALSQWFEFYHYGELTGDEGLLEQLVAEECAECANAVDEIRQLDTEGLWIDGDPMRSQIHM